MKTAPTDPAALASGTDLWPAPQVAEGSAMLDATVEVPGSKSLTNRYLVLAALADGPGHVRGALRSRDTALMAAALQTLGTELDDLPTDGASDLRVTPAPLRGNITIDCGLAGTVMRFLPAVAALASGPVRFDGDDGARVRPMGPILAALRALGVTVRDEGDSGFLPFTVAGRGAVRGGSVDIDASGSSQFVSGLLLAAARFDQGLTIRHTGATLPSLPHIEMTVALLRSAGVHVDSSRPTIWQVLPGPIRARDGLAD